MNWDAVGALAESIGAIGVVASLIYLAAQIRQNTRSLEANTFHSLHHASIERLLVLAQNDELADRFVAGLVDPDSLSGARRFQFDVWMRANLKGYEDYFYQSQQSMLDPESWEAHSRTIQASVSPPGFARWWEQNRHLFREDFARYIDSLQPGSAPTGD